MLPAPCPYHRGRPGALTWCRAVAALTALVALPACTSHRATLPLDTRVAASHDSPRPPQPAAVEVDSTLTEEDLPAPVPPGADGGGTPAADAAALSLDAPSVLDTIAPQTPPNVAAATRLADAARLRMAEGDYAGALEQLERAVAVDSGNPYAYYFLAQLHLVHHTYDQAIAFADRSASLSARHAPQWASRAYVLEGNAFEATGRFADARAAYEHALGAAPNNLAAQVGLSRVGGVIAAP